VLLWDAATGRPLAEANRRTRGAYSAVFGPTGRSLLTAADDWTARVSFADPSGGVLVLRGHTFEVFGAAFSPDGGRVVTVAADGTARLWAAPPRFPIDIYTCAADTLGRRRARLLADWLAGLGGGSAFAPVVYEAAVWDSARSGAPPAAGEIWSAGGDAAAARFAQQLRVTRGSPAEAAVTQLRAGGGGAGPGTAVTVGMCTRPAPAERAVAGAAAETPARRQAPAPARPPRGTEPAGKAPAAGQQPRPVPQTPVQPPPDTPAVALPDVDLDSVPRASADRPVAYSPAVVQAIRESPVVRYPPGAPTPVAGGRVMTRQVVAIILHTTAAPDSASVAILRSGLTGLGGTPGPLAHWAVRTDGTIAFIAPETQRTNNVGRAAYGTTTITNANTIAIEAAGRPAFTDPRQVEALVRLVADVANRWRIPTNMILSHAEVAMPRGRKADMGQQAPAIRAMVDAVRARPAAAK
jgi:hypothetical protein